MGCWVQHGPKWLSRRTKASRLASEPVLKGFLFARWMSYHHENRSMTRTSNWMVKSSKKRGDRSLGHELNQLLGDG